MQEINNFTNIPYGSNHIDFNLPCFSYGSTGAFFDNWGISFHMGKQGMQLGNTKLGSIVYNNTFETDFYSELSIFSERLKYSLNVSQIDNETFLYLHQLDTRPAKNFRLSVCSAQGELGQIYKS